MSGTVRPRKRGSKPGIFALESKWSASATDVRTVKPLIEMLEDSKKVRSVYHFVNDVDDVERQLQRWGQAQHKAYGLGYIALHGSPGRIHVGRRSLDLAELQLPRSLLATKIVHFGSCSVLDVNEQDREAIRKSLGARMLTGFTTDVDWFQSMAFELLLFEALTHFKRPADAIKYVETTHRQLANQLGFVSVSKPG